MGRNHTPNAGLLAAACIALAAGAALPAATAEAQRGSYGDRHHSSGTRGTVCIGRTTHEFWFEGSPIHSMLAAFRECGYDAWISKGSIHVRYHGHRPRFTLRASGYSFGVRYGRGCVIISPKCLAPPPKHIRYRVRDSWGGHDYHPPRRSRGHHGHRAGPRWGWNVNWSWGHRPHYPKHRGWQPPRRCR